MRALLPVAVQARGLRIKCVPGRGPVVFVLAALACVSNFARAASPALEIITPRGAQRGMEADLVFHGDRLTDAQEVLSYTPGISVTKLEVVDPKQVKVHVQIAADAPLGEHCMRLRTETGVSEVRTFFVVAFPVVTAKTPPGKFEDPQKIDLNVTVTGIIDNEAVHHFVVEAKKGHRLTAEVHGMRLGVLFDPYVAILDRNRFELATSDDTALAMQDPIASIIAPQDGPYIIQIRESSYGGGGNSYYLLHVGTFPRPRVVYPLGGPPGQDWPVQFLGDAAGPIAQSVKLPGEPVDSLPVFPVQDGLSAPSPNFVRASPLANVMQVDPNTDIKSATPAGRELPLAFNGIVAHPGETSYFRFAAHKDQPLDIRVIARVLRSPLDSVLTIHDAAGHQMASNDDSGGPDSYLRFNPPADAEYVVGVTDQLRQGGPEYVFRIELTPVRPTLKLTLPQVATNSQERQAIVVPRGNRFATLVRATRTDFGGGVSLALGDLPDGVSVQTTEIADGTDVVPVVFEAAEQAPIAARLSSLTGRPTDPKIDAAGNYSQTIEYAIGPNNTPLYQTHVDKLAVAVAKEAPFKLHLVQPKVPLLQNGSMDLKVQAERIGKFTGNIRVHMLFNAPGVNSAGEIEMPPEKNELIYPLSASEDAATRKWKICVIGEGGADGSVWVSSELVDLEVGPSFLAGKIETTSVEQGKATPLLCNLEQKVKFDGKAVAKLMGLPTGATAADVEVSSADDRVVFNVQTDPKTPAAQHTTLFCQLTLMQNGEPIVLNAARGGVLRVDPPRPSRKDEPAPAPVAAAPKPAATPAAVKPLSRLEKLRQEQQQ